MFLSYENRLFNSSIFVFQDGCAMVSHCPFKNKSVLVLSIMHNYVSIEPESRENKSETITLYNKTKIDVVYYISYVRNIIKQEILVDGQW